MARPTRSSGTIKPTNTFYVFVVLGIIWYGIGVMMYLAQAYKPDSFMSMIPQNQLDFMNSTPKWVYAAFAVAVWFGFLGVILMLLRKKFSRLFFIISFIGLVVQLAYNFIMTNAYDVYGGEGIVQAIITFLISIFYMGFTKRAIESEVLR
ncbi:MAG: hypothetical protein ACON4X_06120 [Polaribacter sp.]